MMALFTRVVGLKMFRRHMMHRHQQFMGGKRADAAEAIRAGADGDINFYTDESQMAREALRWHPQVDAWLRRWWDTVIKNFDKAEDVDGDGVVDRADQELSYNEYVGFHTLLWRAYHFSDPGQDLDEDGIPDVEQVSEEQIAEWREEDWLQDSGGDGKLTGNEFKESVFEMVDMHCATSSLAEYLHCLEGQFGKVFVDAGVEVTPFKVISADGHRAIPRDTVGVSAAGAGQQATSLEPSTAEGSASSGGGGDGAANAGAADASGGQQGPDVVHKHIGPGKLLQRQASEDGSPMELGGVARPQSGVSMAGSVGSARSSERAKSPTMLPSAPLVMITSKPAADGEGGGSGYGTTLPGMFDGKSSRAAGPAAKPETLLQSLTKSGLTLKGGVFIPGGGGPYANKTKANLPPSPIVRVAPSFGDGSELHLALLLDRPKDPPFSRQLHERTGGKYYLAESAALPFKTNGTKRATVGSSLLPGAMGHTLERLPVTIASLGDLGNHYPAR
jgi:hypothetical protein